MIREVLPDFITLVVYLVGGGAMGAIFLALDFNDKKALCYAVDFIIGFLSIAFFIILTEIFLNGVISVHALILYVLGFFVALILFDIKRKPHKKLKLIIAKIKKTCRKSKS